ncbi:MAG: tape measure protein [Defluviicoccus sp.]|nr:tape measure protein [Defluviicoccus sp.]
MPDLDLAIRVRADLQRAAAGLNQLEKELKDVGQAGDRSARGAARVTRSYDRMDAAAGRTARALGSFRGAIAAIGIVAVTRQLIDAGLRIERLEQRFRAATGSADAAAREMAFVRAEAERLGIDFREAADAYSGFLAAAQGTPLAGAAARDIFTAVAEAARVMGLTAEQTGGALLALEQIISKGKVSAEELRGQLGERLPGAFQIAARAMGVSTGELDRMLARGELLAEDLLPKLAVELSKTVAGELPNATRSSAAAFDRLGNAVDRLAEKVANSGLIQFFADLATKAAEALAGAEETAAGPAQPPRTRAKVERDEAAERLARLRERETRFGTERPGRRRRRGSGRGVLPGEVREATEALAEAERQVAGQTVESLTAQIAAMRARARGSQRHRRGLAARLAPLRRDLAVLREREEQALANFAAGFEDRDQAPPGIQAPARAAADPKRAREAEAARDRLVAIARDAEDRVARITLDRIELVDRAEAESYAELDRLTAAALEKVKDDETEQVRTRQASASARTAIERAAAVERQTIREEEAGEAAETTRRRSQAEAAAAARENLAGIERGLLGPYERAVAEVEAWREATIAAYEAAGISAEEYGAIVDAVVNQRLAAAADEEAERRLRASRHWRDGAVRALRDYSDEATDAAAYVEQAVTGGLRNMEDALVQFATTGKLSFKGLVDSIVADLARIAVRQAITGPLFSALGAALGGGAGGGFVGGSFSFGSAPAAFHGGGIAGRGRVTREGPCPAVSGPMHGSCRGRFSEPKSSLNLAGFTEDF